MRFVRLIGTNSTNNAQICKMTDPLFIEIDNFDKWAQSQYSIPQDDLAGEWECNYLHWNKIYASFGIFMANANPALWSDEEKQRLLYIIARDNECEQLAEALPENALIILTKYSLNQGRREDKWQLAIQLHKLSDKQLAADFLETLVNDPDEYVSRRSLMELAKVNPGKIDHYADLFWNRNKYGDMDEYQKIAVLHALKTANSKQLDQYIALAKQDGRQYLVANALELEAEQC